MPLIEIGGEPILCHILKIYSYNGINDFAICRSLFDQELHCQLPLHVSDVSLQHGKELHEGSSAPRRSPNPLSWEERETMKASKFSDVRKAFILKQVVTGPVVDI
ncbi:hypothetical protein XH93_10275 [Bradyrhizobium sp. CCBAU 51753]|nr:hypothetical protein XH93_10275 [Bradyrhizobium sp. CCBAU 51753]